MEEFMNKKKEVINAVSDLATAGIITGLLPYITTLPQSIQNIVNISIPALACGSNVVLRLNSDKIIEKDIQKIEKLVSEINDAMEYRKVEELKHFVELDFPVEVYTVVEEIIKTAVNAKGKWLRKFASHVIVTIGYSDDPNFMEGKQRCLEVIRELNETDLKLLLLYEFHRKYIYEKGVDLTKLEKNVTEIKTEVLNDNSIYAHTIFVSSSKLKRLGLIMRDCSLHPYDETHNTNKAEMLQDFLSQNQVDVTSHYFEFMRYIHGMI